ncbi:MAG: hypothetical protein E7191_05805 [Erysipelotrichaceae bacterium]|nr:hypothetical protein [Erysipelotrichaceae bacterium]
MPSISTHLHLALLASDRLPITDTDAFLLGSVYPDQMYISEYKSVLLHYKEHVEDPCDLKRFLECESKDDFTLGYYYHLWCDEYVKHVELEDITKYDRLICDMEVLIPVIQRLCNNSYTGKYQQSMENIMILEREPMPLYLVSPSKKEKYVEVLESIVDAFVKELECVCNM